MSNHSNGDTSLTKSPCQFKKSLHWPLFRFFVGFLVEEGSLNQTLMYRYMHNIIFSDGHANGTNDTRNLIRIFNLRFCSHDQFHTAVQNCKSIHSVSLSLGGRILHCIVTTEAFGIMIREWHLGLNFMGFMNSPSVHRDVHYHSRFIDLQVYIESSFHQSTPRSCRQGFILLRHLIWDC